MIRIITIAAGCFLGLAVIGAIAQTLQGVGGGATLGTNTFTGAQTLPAGSSGNPSLLFSGSNGGFYSRAAGRIDIGGQTGGATGFLEMDITANNIFALNGTAPLSWANGQAGNAVDTGISRHATAGVVDIGNGLQGSTAGGIQTNNATLLALTTGTNADFLCLNSGGGILIQTTACTISSLRFKPDWKPYQDDAVAKVVKMDVGTFHLQTGPNADPNAQSLQAGLSAESVAAVAPECAIYENDMKTPKSYRQECVIALLVRAVQQLKK